MKVLHLFDMAGVACILAKWLKKAGHESRVINMYDPFGFCEFYKEQIIPEEGRFLAEIERAAPEYDILHVHTVYQMVQQLNKFGRPIVMHYHGTELATNAALCRMLDQRAKLVVVSGKQLLKYHDRARYLPNPVDTEHFKADGIGQGTMAFDIEYLDTSKTREAVPDVSLQPRNCPYNKMPTLLRLYSAYADVRYHRERGLLTDLSKTALEALACGLQVITHDGIVMDALPGEHQPEEVVKNLVELYRTL